MLTLSVGLNAQDLLIPYKKAGKFGLIDQNSKIKIEPKYDQLNWLTGKYFISTVKEGNTVLHGLIHKDKEIIKPQSSLIYRVLPDMMILGVLKDGAELDSPLRYVLYDSNGKKVESAEFKKLELMGTAGIGKNSGTKRPKYALLFSEDFRNRPGIFVFDGDTGKIKEWYFKEVTDFKLLRKNKVGDTYYFSYKDSENKEQKKILKITKENFSFEDFSDEVPEPEIIGTDKNTVIQSKETARNQKHGKRSLYKEEDGKVLYRKDSSEFRRLELSKDILPIFKYTKIKNQAGDLIFKSNNKFGWIRDGEPTKAIYDSITYFGNDYYQACLKKENKFKCGTFSLNLQPVLPIEYDSILGVMNRFGFEPIKGSSDFELKMKPGSGNLEPDEISYVQPVFRNIVGYRDGKAFLMSPAGDQMFSSGFDEVGRNGLNLPGEIETDFIVLKKDGLYGLILTEYDRDSDSNIQQTIEPVFNAYPAFYIKNYYEQPGYILFGLYDENGHFSAYASDFGVVYSD